MSLEITCSNCGKRLSASLDQAGRRGRCPFCRTANLMPVVKRIPPPSADCPSCGMTIEPKPKFRRKCPHCREWLMIRQDRLVKPDEAKRMDELKVRLMLASRLLLPSITVGPPGRRFHFREITEWMPATPPDDCPYSGAESVDVSIDGGYMTYSADSLRRDVASARAGMWTGWRQKREVPGQPGVYRWVRLGES